MHVHIKAFELNSEYKYQHFKLAVYVIKINALKHIYLPWPILHYWTDREDG